MILVTGSEGFIGKHLVATLDALGETVLGSDPRAIEAQMFSSHLTAVFHLGAISDTTCDDWPALVATNMMLTCSLIDFAREKKIPMVYASSASVYGNGSGPLNAYARSKRDADVAAEIQIDQGQQQLYGLRFFNVYGPGEEHKGKQASMVSQMMSGQRTLFDIAAKRDFVYVDDVVSVMLHMWKSRPASGIYDVGTGVARDFRDIPFAIGYTEPTNFIPLPSNLSGKYQFHTQADLTKLRAAGYDKPFLTLEEGIARMTK